MAPMKKHSKQPPRKIPVLEEHGKTTQNECTQDELGSRKEETGALLAHLDFHFFLFLFKFFYIRHKSVYICCKYTHKIIIFFTIWMIIFILRECLRP